VASLAIALGAFLHQSGGAFALLSPVAWGSAAIVLYVLINLAGVAWGGRTQVLLTALKVAGVGALVVGGLFIAAPAGPAPEVAGTAPEGLPGFVRFTGLGIALVLFTYDGWIDASHVAGEVRDPARHFPRALGLGVAAVAVLYLLVNMAFLRVVPLAAMRESPTTVAATVATTAYGAGGGAFLNALMTVSFFGALGGLVMTLPRLFYTVAAEHAGGGTDMPRRFFGALSRVSPRRGVPAGAVIFTGVTSIAALAFFGSFSRLVNFLVVPMQLANVLMVAAVFRLRRRPGGDAGAYRVPGYPVTPLVYIVVMLGFLVSALVYRPLDTLIGLGIALTGGPVYWWLRRGAA
jgi:APA family basic amino acid/polyamine antiporter